MDSSANRGAADNVPAQSASPSPPLEVTSVPVEPDGNHNNEAAQHNQEEGDSDGAPLLDRIPLVPAGASSSSQQQHQQRRHNLSLRLRRPVPSERSHDDDYLAQLDRFQELQFKRYQLGFVGNYETEVADSFTSVSRVQQQDDARQRRLSGTAIPNPNNRRRHPTDRRATIAIPMSSPHVDHTHSTISPAAPVAPPGTPLQQTPTDPDRSLRHSSTHTVGAPAPSNSTAQHQQSNSVSPPASKHGTIIERSQISRDTLQLYTLRQEFQEMGLTAFDFDKWVVHQEQKTIRRTRAKPTVQDVFSPLRSDQSMYIAIEMANNDSEQPPQQQEEEVAPQAETLTTDETDQRTTATAATSVPTEHEKIEDFLKHKFGDPAKIWWKQRAQNKTREGIPMERRQHLASIYIQDAKNSRFPKIHRIGPNPILCYEVFHHRAISWVRSLLTWCLLLLLFAEPRQFGTDSGLFPDWWFMILETGIIVILSLFVLAKLYAEGIRDYVRNIWNVVQAIVILALIADIATMYLFPPEIRFHWARFLRPLLPLTESTSLRKMFNTVLRTLPNFIEVLFLLFIFVAMFSVIGFCLFYQIYESELSQNFDTVWKAAVGVFIFLTTESFPDFMRPATMRSAWYLCYFIPIILGGTFVLVPMCTAIIYDEYKSQLQKQALDDRIKERKALAAAFEILNIHQQNELPYGVVRTLLQSVAHKESYEYLQMITHSQTINLPEFFDLCDLLFLHFELRSHSSRGSISRKCNLGSLSTIFADNSLIETIRLFQQSNIGRWLYYAALFVGCLSFLVFGKYLDAPLFPSDSESSLWNIYNSWWFVVDGIDLFIVILFAIELAFRLIILGPNLFWEDPWNGFDFVCVLTLLCSQFVLITPIPYLVSMVVNGSTSIANVNHIRGVCRIFSTVRIIRLLRITRYWTNFQVIFHTLRLAVWTICEAFGFVLLIAFEFGIWGMILFAGPTSLSTIPGNDTPYMNFDSFGNGLLLLLQVLTTSNWHELMNIAARATNNVLAALFFISFYVVAVLVLLNVIISIILEFYSKQRTVRKMNKSFVDKIKSPSFFSSQHDESEIQPPLNLVRLPPNSQSSDSQPRTDDNQNSVQIVPRGVNRQTGIFDYQPEQENTVVNSQVADFTAQRGLLSNGVSGPAGSPSSTSGNIISELYRNAGMQSPVTSARSRAGPSNSPNN